MEKDRNKMAKRVLNLTLEIIYLLTGEDYTVVKKTCGEYRKHRSNSPMLGGQSRSRSPITGLLPHSLPHERNNEQKILDLTNKIIHLLTGEVPIRCQDVAVYFSMEEWEYIEGHKDLYRDAMMEEHWPLTSPGKRDLYKDVMMEDHQPLTSPDGSSTGSTPKRCPSPLYSQDCPGESHNVLRDHQCEDLNDIKVEVIVGEEETYMLEDQQCKEEKTPAAISPDDWTRGSKGDLLLSPDYEVGDINVTQDTYEEHYITPTIPSVLHLGDLSTDRKEQSSDTSQTVKQSEGHREYKLLYPCSECGKCFKKKLNLSKHEIIHRDDNPFSCLECGKCFQKKLNLSKHEIIHRDDNLFSCLECGKCFQKKRNLSRHERLHRDNNSFSCLECGKCFKKESKLSIHKRIHRDERKFECPDCGKGFTTKSDLVKHKRIHTGEKPFSCSECGKCFTWKSDLVKHQRIHTGEKPFSCSECGRCFTRKSDLIKHERIHTGKKPYSCSECAKCFTQRSNLVEHQKIHTGQRPFSCSECRRCFTRKSNLVEHLRIHTGEKLSSGLESRKPCPIKGPLEIHQGLGHSEKPYSCIACGEYFTQESGLFEHQKHHVQVSS
ncbi:uncharacterized protein LOC142663700 [Rhinoderma darwinii]|uniref:uncharacterized protein LOC142663700 n=1 Tax=Rhinoderma darwinii TaxID=43563 RepID=UPI003F66D665